MRVVKFLPEAELEFLKEVAYDADVRPGAGVKFQSALELALARAARHPMGGAPSFHGTRGVLEKGFPLSVVYRETPALLLVIAVVPHRRRPNDWARRRKR